MPTNKILILLLLTVALILPGCTETKAPDGKVIFENNSPLQFGVLPFLEDQKLIEALTPLINEMEKKTGHKIEIRIFGNYADLQKMVKQNKIDMGWFTPTPTNAGDNSTMVSICRPVPASGEYYCGAIVARSDSGISRLTDLKDKIFTYVDRNSNSGFFYPNKLFTSNGINPVNFFGTIRFSGTHDRSLQDLLNNKTDAAAISEFLLKDLEKGLITIIATTSKILPDPIVVKSDMSENLRKSLAEILIGLKQNPHKAPILEKLQKTLRIKGFAAEDIK